MKKAISTILITLAVALAVSAQTEQPTVTISQDTADKLFVLAEKGKAFDKYVEKAEADIRQRDDIIQDLKIKLSAEVQKSVDLENEGRNQRALITALIPALKKKCTGLCIQF